MFEEINAKLVEIQGELRKGTKYKVQLTDYDRDLEAVEHERSKLRRQFLSEQKDVTKLESISLTSLLATLAGTKDVKLIKEKQEMFLAQNKLVDAEKAKKDIEESMHWLREKIHNLDKVEQEYQQLLLQKENIIKTSSLPIATRVFELSEQEGAIKAYLTELNEAINAGHRVRMDLAGAKKSLESAEGWGTWDLFGGGLISGIAKHQHIDDAKEKLSQAQASMRQFQKELLDVQEQAHINVDISGMLKFADFFFDGFFVDYIVQNKIRNAFYETESNYNRISDIVDRLNKQYGENMQTLQAIQKEKQEIVESM